MAKYAKAVGKKVETAMKELKKGTLKTGSGKKVTDKKQAIAIGLSVANKEAAMVPAKKSATKKVVAKKSAPNKGGTPQKSAATKKVAANKTIVSNKVEVFKKEGASKKSVTSKPSIKKKSVSDSKVIKTKRSEKSNEATPATEVKNRLRKVTQPINNEVTEPQVEKDDVKIPVQEPVAPTAEVSMPKGNPIPAELYSTSGDNFHGHTKATESKSSVKPAGKKPLWNN